jgi:hypothetical protein
VAADNGTPACPLLLVACGSSGFGLLPLFLGVGWLFRHCEALALGVISNKAGFTSSKFTMPGACAAVVLSPPPPCYPRRPATPAALLPPPPCYPRRPLVSALSTHGHLGDMHTAGSRWHVRVWVHAHPQHREGGLPVDRFPVPGEGDQRLVNARNDCDRGFECFLVVCCLTGTPLAVDVGAVGRGRRGPSSLCTPSRYRGRVPACVRCRRATGTPGAGVCLPSRWRRLSSSTWMAVVACGGAMAAESSMVAPTINTHYLDPTQCLFSRRASRSQSRWGLNHM